MDILLQVLTLLLREEDREKRRQHLGYLRDTTNPFDVEENIFRQFFRIPKQLAMELIEKLEQHNAETSDTPFALRVSIILKISIYRSKLNNYGAGFVNFTFFGSWFLPKKYTMSQPSVSQNITYICELMVSNMAHHIKFCEDQEEKNTIKEGFYTKFGIKGVIIAGAINCTHVGIVAPPIYDPERPARLYMNRKGYYSINVEAIVDSNLKFLSVNAKYAGSVHDSAIWATTPARINLIRQHNSCRYNWLVGDSGYPLEPWLLTPFSQPASLQDEKFNKLQIKARNIVERAFGVLKNRFRCLNKCRTLHYAPEAAKIIYTCIILHNMLLNSGINHELEDEAITHDEDEGEFEHEHSVVTIYLNEGQRMRNEYTNTL